jgi:hypothetical protein
MEPLMAWALTGDVDLDDLAPGYPWFGVPPPAGVDQENIAVEAARKKLQSTELWRTTEVNVNRIIASKSWPESSRY